MYHHVSSCRSEPHLSKIFSTKRDHKYSRPLNRVCFPREMLPQEDKVLCLGYLYVPLQALLAVQQEHHTTFSRNVISTLLNWVSFALWKHLLGRHWGITPDRRAAFLMRSPDTVGHVLSIKPSKATSCLENPAPQHTHIASHTGRGFTTSRMGADDSTGIFTAHAHCDNFAHINVSQIEFLHFSSCVEPRQAFLFLLSSVPWPASSLYLFL